jgi:hypothetical protein
VAQIIEHDMQTASQLLLAAGRLYGTALGARTLPLLVVVCLPTRGRRLPALGWSALVLLAGALLLALEPSLAPVMVITALVLGYDALAACACFWLTRPARTGVLRADALFCLLALVFLLVPVPILRGLGHVELLAVGWHITLSIYSYCLELPRSSQVVRLRSFLFFALVDPTVSFPDRARPVRVDRTQVAKRLASGVALVCMGYVLVRVQASAGMALAKQAPTIPRLVALPVTALVVFFSVYWTRAGVAHLRIGMMQMLGKQPPECFNHPYLATSPLDFWRRWNIWLGDWVRRYLFVPLSLWLLRRGRPTRSRQTVASAFAILGSFAAMGLLHDWLIFADRGALIFPYLRVFAFAAAMLLVWEAVAARRPGLPAVRSGGLLMRLPAALGAATYICTLLVVLERI